MREEREERREKVTIGNKKKIGLTFMLQGAVIDNSSL